jgi:ABC-type multidrug transport system ATPase subunit
MTLQIDSVTHRFRKQTVLRDVSLAIQPGDCYGLLGHNGAGKTTLLRIALGLLKPASGRVTIDGFDAAAFPREACARRGGLVEYPGFHETWDGLKNLRVWARLQGFDHRRSLDEARRVCALVGLDRYDGVTERKRVGDYSQGMKQRLGIAQALIGEPSFILLDEPMNGLDPQAIVEMRSLIRRLTREANVAVVLSSHQLAEISGLCNRIAILREGVLLVEGAMERLLENEEKRYRLRVAASPESTIACLESFHVAHRLVEGSVTDSTFEMDLGEDTPTALTRHLLDHGIDLLALFPCNPSLEEVYLRIEAQAGDSIPADAPHAAASSLSGQGRPPMDRAPRWPLFRGVHYDLTRLVGGGKTLLLMVLPALVASLSIGLLVRDAAGQMEPVGEEVFSATQVTAFDGMGRGLKTGLPILMVFMAGLASQAIAGEQSRGTLRYLLLRPIHRVQVTLSKFCSLLLVCMASYLLLLVASVCVSAYFLDFGDLAELLPNGKLFPLVTREAMFEWLWPVLYGPILPLVCYTGIGLALGSLIRSNVGALVTTLGAILVLDLGRVFIPRAEAVGWLPSAHLPSALGGHSACSTTATCVQGVSNATNPHASLALVTPLVWAVLARGRGRLPRCKGRKVDDA